MSWLEKAKVWLGVIDAVDLEDDGALPRAQRHDKDGRPSLDGIESAPQETLEDALAAREAGELKEMRRLLRDMDRGRGLRLVLRAAAALENDDERELGQLLPKVRREQPAWRLPLQLAGALDDSERAQRFVDIAARHDPPAWASAWSRALSSDSKTQRQGLVALLFTDAALARTVAARDLELDDVQADPNASQRYVAFAHGRRCIERFGAEIVADLLERAHAADGDAS